MLTRIVKMTFDPEKQEDFELIFETSKEKIRDFEGCLHVELGRDQANGNVFFTYSKWTSKEHLDAYRNSEFFRATWAKTKALFIDKPEAYSVATIYSSEESLEV